MNEMEAASMATKAAPPVAVSAASVAGLPLSEWVYILTILYLIAQIVWFVIQRVKDYKEYMNGRE